MSLVALCYDLRLTRTLSLSSHGTHSLDTLLRKLFILLRSSGFVGLVYDVTVLLSIIKSK